MRAADPTGAEETLAGYADLISAAIREYLTDGAPAVDLYDLVREYPNRAGKGLRSALLLATCQAFGGRARDALAPALALELLHNAFLVHDDVEDASRSRRGASTLHEAYGVGLAVNAGDALAALALGPLREDPALGARTAARLQEQFAEAVRHTVEGQAMDLGWRRRQLVDLEPDDYVAMTVRKTAWYTAVLPLRAGALIGSHGTASLGRLTRFGCFLGVAFQIHDDLLNLRDGGFDGKDQYGDLREGKRTLIILHLLDVAPEPERSGIVEFLRRPEESRSDEEIEQVVRAMNSHGSIRFAEEFRASMISEAESEFGPAFAEAPDSVHKEFLRSLVSYVVERRR
jgi:geranylgeranyl diphosphate synthase type II